MDSLAGTAKGARSGMPGDGMPGENASGPFPPKTQQRTVASREGSPPEGLSPATR